MSSAGRAVEPTLNCSGRTNRFAEVNSNVAWIGRIHPHFYRRSRLQCARLDRPDRLLDLNVVRRTTGDLHPERDLDQLPPADDDHRAARTREKDLSCSGCARHHYSVLCSNLFLQGTNRCQLRIDFFVNKSDSPDDETHQRGNKKYREDNRQDEARIHLQIIPYAKAAELG